MTRNRAVTYSAPGGVVEVRDINYPTFAVKDGPEVDPANIGGAIGIPGLYVTGDPGGVDDLAKRGSLSFSLGTGWAKSLSFSTGQCPVMRYHRPLMEAILADKVTNTKPRWQ